MAKLSIKKSAINIPVYYRLKETQYGNAKIQIVDDEIGNKGGPGIEVLHTKWKRLTWQTNNNLYQSSTTWNQVTGSTELDFIKYQDNMFKACLLEWDIVDEEGKPLPVTPENIDELPVEIARALLAKFDQTTKAGEEDAKK